MCDVQSTNLISWHLAAARINSLLYNARVKLNLIICGPFEMNRSDKITLKVTGR